MCIVVGFGCFMHGVQCISAIFGNMLLGKVGEYVACVKHMLLGFSFVKFTSHLVFMEGRNCNGFLH